MISKANWKQYILLIFSVTLFISVFVFVPKVELQEEIDEYNIYKNVTQNEDENDELKFYLVGIENIESLHSEYVGELSFNRFNVNFIIAIGTKLEELFNDENNFENNKEAIGKYFAITSNSEYITMYEVCRNIYEGQENNNPSVAIIVEESKKILNDGIEFAVNVSYKSGKSQIFTCKLFNNEKEFGAVMKIMPKLEG